MLDLPLNKFHILTHKLNNCMTQGLVKISGILRFPVKIPGEKMNYRSFSTEKCSWI